MTNMTDLNTYIKELGCEDGINVQITKQIVTELIEGKPDCEMGKNLNISYLKTAKTCYVEFRDSNKLLEIYIPIYFDTKIDLHQINRLRAELSYSEEYNLILAICDSNLTILYYEFNNFDINEI